MAPRSRRLFWWFLFLTLACAGCGQKTPPLDAAAAAVPASPPVVRVRLLQNVSEARLGAARPPIIRWASGTILRLTLPSPSADGGAPVHLAPTGWKIGSAQLAAGELTIEPDSDAGVAVAGQFYRGTFHLIPVSATTFDVVNHVNIDSYIKGVLTREMRREFLPEAYEAQAIVSRTYALYEWKFAPHGRSWDLYADTRSQMYGGVAAETDKSRDATDRTRGVVVASGPAGQERIFKAYFSACCGGAGQSAAQAFGDPAAEALSDRAVGNRCAESPRFNWGPVIIPKDVLTRRLRAFGLAHGRSEKDMAALAGIEIARSNASGRPIEFTVTDARGARYLLTGEELRLAVNTDAQLPSPAGPRLASALISPIGATSSTTLMSSFVRPVSDGSSIRFENGHGNGHGVGMCQWCAQAEAKQGISHERIVLDAFHGAKLVRAY